MNHQDLNKKIKPNRKDKWFLRETKDFGITLFKNPFFLVMSAVFIFGKLAVNLTIGAKVSTSLRSALLGYILYIAGCYWISLFSARSGFYQPIKSEKRPYGVFIWVLMVIAVLTLDILYRNQMIDFKIPLWNTLNTSWRNLVSSLMQKYDWIEGTGLIGWPYLILYMLIPYIIAKLSGIRVPRVTGYKSITAVLPFVLLYVAAFVFTKGVSIKNVFTLIAVIIWPALGEEYLFRGILQPTLTNMTRKPVTAIVITSLLFAASHIPTYILASSGSTLLGWSGLLPIMLMSFFWGYGYYRTGALWPWILIHAFSDLVTL